MESKGLDDTLCMPRVTAHFLHMFEGTFQALFAWGGQIIFQIELEARLEW